MGNAKDFCRQTDKTGKKLYAPIYRCLIDCTVFHVVFNSQFYCGGKCTYPCFPGILLTSNPHNVLFKPPATFPPNHCRNNGQQRERNECCRIDYHQSSERILAEPGISDLLFSSPQRYQLSYVARHIYRWGGGAHNIALPDCVYVRSEYTFRAV